MPKVGEKSERPWGAWQTVDAAPGFQVKRITVRPGGRLSLQSHEHRSEHWLVAAGEAEVTVGDEVRRLRTGEHVDVPLRARHRLANPGEETLELVEVQLGDYLEEDDITRYEDDYGRE